MFRCQKKKIPKGNWFGQDEQLTHERRSRMGSYTLLTSKNITVPTLLVYKIPLRPQSGEKDRSFVLRAMLADYTTDRQKKKYVIPCHVSIWELLAVEWIGSHFFPSSFQYGRDQQNFSGLYPRLLMIISRLCLLNLSRNRYGGGESTKTYSSHRRRGSWC